MLDQFIWWGSIALEFLLLFRGFRQKLLRHYPIFFSYVFVVLAEDLVRFLVLQWRSQVYSYVYWASEFLSIVIGCGIVFETYRSGLRAYPGAARMARRVLAAVFALAFIRGVGAASQDRGWWAAATVTEVQRSLRAVEAVSIIALVVLLLFYSIPLGRNLRGILLGYGLFVGTSTIWLTFAYPGGHEIRQFWLIAYPLSYFLALCIWTAYLWTYRANPQIEGSIQLEAEYQRIAIATRRRLHEARGHLRRVVRP